MKKAKHRLSNYKLATFNMGELVPVGLTEVVRGDSIRQKTTALVRFAPLLAPVMHPVHVKIHHWFVPHRLSWVDYENFITAGPDGTSRPTFPTITFPQNGPEIGTLADYLGVPPDNPAAAGTTVSALPFRAYARIFNEFYRDQDLQTALTVSTASGADSTTSVALQNACWMKDYFTTCRPEPQKGPEITIPVTGEAPVLGMGKVNTTYARTNLTVYESDATQSVYANAAGIQSDDANRDFAVEMQDVGGTNYPNMRVDGADFDAIPVIDFRLAMALQRIAEARSQYGSRFSEYLAYYGIRSSDARLQRPEYLGGGRETIKFTEVLQTAPAFDSVAEEQIGEVGDLKGHGISSVRSNAYNRFFEEDGYIVSLMVVNPITMYVQGLARHWNYTVREDMFQKELQHVGQQAVLNKEVYAAHATPNGTFGYQDRYDHLRRIENSVAGEFRSTLNYWGLWRIFSSDPSLNADFVSANPTNRIFASTATDQLQVYVKHDIKARRLVSKFGKSYIY